MSLSRVSSFNRDSRYLLLIATDIVRRFFFPLLLFPFLHRPKGTMLFTDLIP